MMISVILISKEINTLLQKDTAIFATALKRGSNLCGEKSKENWNRQSFSRNRDDSYRNRNGVFLLLKTSEELTDKQKKFAEGYLELSNGTKAAIQAGYAEAGAHTEASRLLKNVKVKGYIDELYKERRERVQNRLATMAEKAAEMMYELATTADSESVRLTAIKDILDRAGYKAVEKLENKNEHSGKIIFGFRDPSLKEE